MVVPVVEDLQRPPHVRQYVVDTIRVNRLLRPRTGQGRRPGECLVWQQSTGDRGLGNVLDRSAPPVLASMWQAPEVQEQADEHELAAGLLEFTSQLMPPLWVLELAGAPLTVALYLAERRHERAYRHEGFQVQLWLDQVHLHDVPGMASETRRRVWPVVIVHEVAEVHRCPDAAEAGRETLRAELGYLADRPEPVEVEFRADRVSTEVAKVWVTANQPPPPGLYASLADSDRGHTLDIVAR